MIQKRIAKLLSTLLSTALIASILTVASPAQAALLPPVIATVSPVSGSITGGDLVTITGSNLQYVNGVAIGANSARSELIDRATDGSWLKFQAPGAAVTGKFDITLYSDSQVNVTEPQAYTYTSTSITAVSPGVGTFLGGTNITITGTGFGPMTWGDPSLVVTVGGNAATNVARVSPTQITATTPAGTIGTVDVVVKFSNYNQDSKWSNNVITGAGLFKYGNENVSPTITSISPDKGPIAGGQDVTINGKYLRGTDLQNGVFTFDGLVATVKSVNQAGTSAVVTTPAHAAGQVNVQVTTVDGTASINSGYQYGPPPTITSVSANGGVTNGGTKVTITGTNFGTAGAPVVRIGGKLALCVKLVNSTTITAATRDNVAGPADVQVTATTGAGTTTLPGGYTFREATVNPNITGISPNAGPVSGNTAVTITTDGAFPADVPNVMFGSLCALSVTRVNAQTIVAVSPASPEGPKNLTMTWANGYAMKSLGYTYFIPTPPAVSSVTPAIDWSVGGALVTISGRDFGNLVPTVKFGTVTATNIVSFSDTQIVVTVPANTVGPKDVTVIPNGSATPITKSSAFTYKAPVITTITPNNGTTAGGTRVTIVGDGFGDTGTPTVTFGGKAATSIVRVSATEITAVTPSGTKGFTRVVVTPNGGGFIASDNAYAYTTELVTPLIYGSTPGVGPSAGGVTVTLTGKNFIGTDGRKGTIKIAGQNASNVSINAAGNTATFTSPALSPGYYVIEIKTNEGTAWRSLYRVYPPPSSSCSDLSPQVVSPDGGTTIRVYATNLWNTYDVDGTYPPTVTIAGSPATVTTIKGSTWFGQVIGWRNYVEFTDNGVGGYGFQRIQVSGANAGTITFDQCFKRQASATITADDKSITYGDQTPVFTKTVVGERDGDVVTTVTYTFIGKNGTIYGPSTTPPTATGSYIIRPSNAAMNPSSHLGRYGFSYIDGTYTITGKAHTLVATCSGDKVYDGAALTHSITDVPDGEVVKGATISWSGADANGNAYGPTATAPKNAGTYTVNASYVTFNSGNEVSYSFSYTSSTCKISKRVVEIVALNQSKTYGDADPALPWEFFDKANTNLVDGESLTGNLSRDKAGTDPGEPVGAYEINIGNLAINNVNYEIEYIIPDPDDENHPGEYGYLVINPKAITVTAANKTKVYGNDDPALTYTTSPASLPNGEDIFFTGSLEREAGNDVGDYAITQGTLDSENYTITFVDGNFEITPRPIRVRFDDQSKVYGELDPTFTRYVEQRYQAGDLGLVYQDTLAGILTGDATRESGANVGTYAISKGTLAPNANYTITWINATLTITKRPVSLSAADTTKIYGDADPTDMLDWTEDTPGEAEGLVNGDTITGLASREEGEDVGDYDITIGTLAATSNYELSFSAGKLTITKRPISVTPNAASKTYGDNDPEEFTYSISSGNTVFGDTLVGNIGRNEGEDVADYDFIISESFTTSNPNYDVTIDNSNANKFTINKRDITITADDDSKTYGDDDPTFTYTLSLATLPNGTTVSFNGSLARDAGNNVGDYDITQGTLATGISGDLDNYNVTFNGGTLTINKKSISVYADDQTEVYGEPLPSNTVDTNDTLPYSDALGTATFEYSTATPSDVGTYDITPSEVTFTSGSAGNYTISYVKGSLEITKRPVYLAVNNDEKIYGSNDPESFSYTVNTGVAKQGIVNSDPITGAASRDEGENVDTYDITPGTLSAGTNYDIFIDSGTFEIKPFPVVITPDAQTREYGLDDPELTYTLDSTLPNSETLSGGLGREAGDDVDVYDFNLGDLVANNPNYSITLDPTSTNKFTITKRKITITADAMSKTFGDADPDVFTYTKSVTTLANGNFDSITGALTRAAGEDVDVNNYDINQGDLDGGANFEITSYTGAKFTINPRDLHITADDQEATYGDDTLPSNSYTLDEADSLVGSDAIGTASYAYDVATPKNAGTYSITPSALVFTSGTASNYNVIYQDGTLTIARKQITVTAADKSKTYGETDPEFTFTVNEGGLEEGDSLTGTLSRDAGEDVQTGGYDITQGSVDNTSNANYDITFVKANLEIKKYKVKVRPSANQEKTYGDNDPTLTLTTDSTLPNGETLAGELGRETGEDVDTYDYNLGDLVESNSNYEIELDPANTNTFRINKRPITVTIENLEKFYGDVDPEFSFTYSPTSLQNGETITLDGSPTRAPGEDVADYSISSGTLDGGQNFTVTIATGSPKLTIKKRPISVTAANQTSVYGENLPSNSFTLTSGTMANSETLTGVSYDYDAADPVHVGSYDIIPSEAVFGNGGKESNYEVTYVDGTLTITKATLVITIENASIYWGEDTPSFTARETSGLVGSDEIGDFSVKFDGSTTEPTDVGGYVLDGVSLDSMASGSLNDYEVEFVPATYVINGPFVINFNPPRGPIAGGTEFTILGLGFGFENPTVLFDGLEATDVVLVDSGTITGVTPPHAEGPVDVTLVTDAGTVELGKVFTYFPPPPAPKINSLGPIQGPTAGGTEITLDGSAFIGSDGKVGKIYVDGVLIKNPKFSKDGKTLIIKTGEHPAGKVDIRVETKDGSFNYKDAFEFIPGLRSLKVLVIFGGDSSWLQPAARKQLDALAAKIRGKGSLAINANGWVNKTKQTAKDAKLSADRANRVVKYLIKKGVDAVFTINGKGIYQSGNANLNRRAELDISYIE